MKTTLIPDQVSELKKHFKCFNKTLKSSGYKKKEHMFAIDQRTVPCEYRYTRKNQDIKY